MEEVRDDSGMLSSFCHSVDSSVPLFKSDRQSFDVRQNQILPQEVILQRWSKSSDLLALVSSKARLSVFRLNWQRWMSLDLRGEEPEMSLPTQIAWRPDGKVICLGTKAGTILCVDVEARSRLWARELAPGLASSPVTELQWIRLPAVSPDAGFPVLGEYFGELAPVIGAAPDDPLSKPGTESSDQYQFSLPSTDYRSIDLLLAGTEDGLLHLGAFGNIGLLTLHLPTLLPSLGEDRLRRVRCALVDPGLSSICCVLDDPEDDSTTPAVVLLPTPFLPEFLPEISVFGDIGLHVDALGSYLQHSFEAVADRWTHLHTRLRRRFGMLQEVLRDEGVDSSPDLEWKRLMLTGVPTQHMRRFLGYLAESVLREQHTFSRQNYSGMLTVLQTNLRPAAERLLFLLHHAQTRFGVHHLPEKESGDSDRAPASRPDIFARALDYESLMVTAQHILVQTEVLRLKVLESRDRCEHFFDWVLFYLHNAAVGEEDPETGEPLPFDEDIDIQQAWEFLSQVVYQSPDALSSLLSGTALSIQASLSSILDSWRAGEKQLHDLISSFSRRKLAMLLSEQSGHVSSFREGFSQGPMRMTQHHGRYFIASAYTLDGVFPFFTLLALPSAGPPLEDLTLAAHAPLVGSVEVNGTCEVRDLQFYTDRLLSVLLETTFSDPEQSTPDVFLFQVPYSPELMHFTPLTSFPAEKCHLFGFPLGASPSQQSETWALRESHGRWLLRGDSKSLSVSGPRGLASVLMHSNKRILTLDVEADMEESGEDEGDEGIENGGDYQDETVDEEDLDVEE